MRNLIPSTLVALSILFISVVQGCSSDSGQANNNASGKNSGETDNTKQAGSLGIVSNLDIPTALSNASNGSLFGYQMDGATGGTIAANAMLFEPSIEAPSDGHPLLVWAHGTTGIANACAPSTQPNRFLNTNAVNQLLGAGYAVLVPDYEGFGTDQIHPYYVRSSHANAVLDAIPAVHKITGVNVSDDWAIVGHSQGGHVALAAARATQLAAYPLQAVVALAPGTDLVALSKIAFAEVDRAIQDGDIEEAGNRLFFLNLYGTYIAHATSLVEPSFDPKVMFGDTVANLIDMALDENNCGEYAAALAAALRQHAFSGAPLGNFEGLKRDWDTLEAIGPRLLSEAMGDESQSMPLLIVQGNADQQIPVKATSDFAAQQTSLGTDITYFELNGADHSDVARANFNFALDWLVDRFPPQ